MDDVTPLLAYWSWQPPAHVLLAAVHMKPKNPRRSKGAGQLDLPNGSTEAELLASGLMTFKTKNG